LTQGQHKTQLRVVWRHLFFPIDIRFSFLSY